MQNIRESCMTLENYPKITVAMENPKNCQKYSKDRPKIEGPYMGWLNSVKEKLHNAIARRSPNAEVKILVLLESSRIRKTKVTYQS